MSMPAVSLPRAGIVTSRVGFGTSRLHYLDTRERQRLLAAVVDHGMVHFDTAPCYGDGLAEIELGRLLRLGRSRFVVASKYGLPADPLVAQMGSLGTPVRAARALARQAGFWRQARPILTDTGLRDSVRASLRRLRSDRIDILLLHEPSLPRIPSLPDLLAEMCRLRDAGTVGAFGLAGPWHDIIAVAKQATELPLLLQTGEAEWGDDDTTPDITYSAITRGPQGAFSARAEVDTAAERLVSALLRRPAGVVLVSTTRVDHLNALVASVQRGPACSAT